MGRIGGKAILYFEIVTTIALFVGLGAVNLVKPGVGVQLAKAPAPGLPQAHTSFAADRRAHVPHQHHRRDGARRCAADRRVRLHFRRRLRGHRRQSASPWSQFCDSLAEIMFRFTNYVMLFAPLGVFGAIAATVGQKGTGRAAESRQAGGDAVRRAGDRRRDRLRRVGDHRANSDAALHRLSRASRS